MRVCRQNSKQACSLGCESCTDIICAAYIRSLAYMCIRVHGWLSALAAVGQGRWQLVLWRKNCGLWTQGQTHLQRRRAKPSQGLFRRTQKSHVFFNDILQENLYGAREIPLLSLLAFAVWRPRPLEAVARKKYHDEGLIHAQRGSAAGHAANYVEKLQNYGAIWKIIFASLKKVLISVRERMCRISRGDRELAELARYPECADVRTHLSPQEGTRDAN